ncbi:MAG: DUF2752 domain-containing protein [Muribaculaceae bacterium]|nr:DUF2752 domain-containing protein [Muribaculaceae bacterium]
MQKRRTWPLLMAAIAMAGVLYVVYAFDPMGGGFPFPQCVFKSLTGWNCPGCGATRALHALLHGEPAAAWRANPAVFFAVPLAALALIADRRGAYKLRRVLFAPGAIAVLIAAILAWTLLRNLLCL